MNQSDIVDSGCIMENLALCVSSETKLQIGWRYTDSEIKTDILDTNL